MDKTFDSGALILWKVKPAAPMSVPLEFLPSIALKNGSSWKNESWTKYSYHRFDNLEPYTTYNVTVYVRQPKLGKVYPPAYYLKFVSGKGGK